MSGVRNLRAMFEQRGENNPPDRGRSPGLSVAGSPSPTDSPRPLSKVRTSFVAIEKDGRIGLRREPSGDSVSASVSSRRFSNDTDTSAPQATSEKGSTVSDSMAKNVSAFKTNLAQVEAIPESPKLDAPAKFSPKKNGQSPNLAPSMNPDKTVDVEEPKTQIVPGTTTEKSAKRENGTTPPTSSVGAPNNKAKTTATAKPAPKAAPISTARTAAKAPKSPMTSKAPKSPTREAARASSLAPAKKITPAASKDHDTAPKKAAATTKTSGNAGKKPAPIDLHSTAGTGFVKPKPKSPTRPLKLPSSLMAPTASSASKLGGGGAAAQQPPRQSLSRASGTAPHLSVSQASSHHRPSSRVSNPNSGTAVKSLRRQSSTINRPRPSLGPPPKQPARDHPVAKRDGGHVDEGFLARMMRPTQSSSSKHAEKVVVPVTPPRRQHGAPPSAHARYTGGSGTSAERSVKKAAKVHAATNNKGVKSGEEAKESPKISPKTSPKINGKEAPTAKDVAPVVAQKESAEAAVEVAKSSKDTAVSPLVEKMDSLAVSEPKTPTTPEESKASTPEQTSEAAAVASPAVTEGSQKVEDLVQEAVEEPVDQTPAEPVVEAAPAVEEPVTGASDEEPKVEEPTTPAGEDVQAEEQPMTPEAAEAETKEETPPPPQGA